MRIGLLIYDSLDTLSGGHLYDRKLVEHLRRQGDQVELVSLPRRSYARRLGDNFSADLLRRLADLPVDVLLQDEGNHPSLAWLNQRMRGQVQYPIASIIHHLRSNEMRPGLLNRCYGWIERRYLGSVDGFIFNSQTTRNAVERLAGKGRPAVVAYPGGDRLRPDVSTVEIKERAWQAGPLRLLFLGNAIARKELHTLLAAAGQLPRKYWRLEVAGAPEVGRGYSHAIQRRVASSGLAENVYFLGQLGEAGLRDCLKTSQLLVAPSSYEGFGITYLEGMGFGLPAIASTNGGAEEIITHGANGYLVPPGEANSLAKHLQTLAFDRGRLAALSLAARRRFAAHPTWEQTGDRLRKFLLSFVVAKNH